MPNDIGRITADIDVDAALASMSDAIGRLGMSMAEAASAFSQMGVSLGVGFQQVAEAMAQAEADTVAFERVERILDTVAVERQPQVEIPVHRPLKAGRRTIALGGIGEEESR